MRIRDILLDPENINWGHEQISNLLKLHVIDSKNDDYKMAELLTHYLLLKRETLQKIADNLSPVVEGVNRVESKNVFKRI